MVKKYVSPETAIVEMELQQQFLAGSGGFTEGEGGDIGTGSGTVDPGEALSRGFNLWDD